MKMEKGGKWIGTVESDESVGFAQWIADDAAVAAEVNMRDVADVQNHRQFVIVFNARRHLEKII